MSQQARRAYDFLRARLDAEEVFTLDELRQASGWKEGTTKINMSKKLAEFVYSTGGGSYQVSPRFRRVRLEEFLDLFGQKRRLFAQYGRCLYPRVIVYDFFLPLTHEEQLREALDDLFYADGLRQRLHEIGMADIKQRFPAMDGETDEDLLERVTKRAADVFGGYSIQHVSGRFRAADLMSYQEAAQAQANRDRYLINETTAVVRFIAPVGSPLPERQQPELPVGAGDNEADEEAEEIRWLFLNVFAGAVIRQVKQEDEIWLLETGERNGLYVWSSNGS